MTLYKDAAGQLVIAGSLPPGGASVAPAASGNLADIAPWLRGLDSNGSTDWHPANYYGDGGEAVGTLSGYLTKGAVVLAADENGAVSDFSAASGNFIVTKDGVDITASCAFAASGAVNMAAGIDAAGHYSISALNGDIGTIMFTATYMDRSIGLEFTVTKAAAGLDGQAYLVIVESTNGTEFRVGQSTTTLIKAHVFKNGVEITDSLPESMFRWRRVSMIPQPYPNDDATWNTLYMQGYKQVAVNVDDVLAQASFFCDILTN